MIHPKKFGKFALRFLAIAHLFAAAACWRMNGIWEEKTLVSSDPELTHFIARGYLFVAAGAFLSSVMIVLAMSLIKDKGKHRA